MSGEPVDWMAQLKGGDSAAWSRLYAFVRRTVVSQTQRSRAVDPDDVACDVVGLFWESLGRLRDDTRVCGYLKTMVWRIGRRKKERSSTAVASTGPSRPSTSDAGARNLEADELLAALVHHLSDAEREFFRLLFVVGACEAEIEKALSVPRRIVWQRKHRLLKKLRGKALRCS